MSQQLQIIQPFADPNLALANSLSIIASLNGALVMISNGPKGRGFQSQPRPVDFKLLKSRTHPPKICRIKVPRGYSRDMITEVS